MIGELWRLQSDAVIGGAIGRYLPGPGNAVLKTDLYDETVSAGLFEALAERYARVAGVDIDAGIAEAAAGRHPGLEPTVADVRKLPFADGEFDAVLSHSTLDHFTDRAEVLRALTELRRVLRPEGRMLVTMDNPLNPLVALRNRMPGGLARRLRGGFGYPTGWTCGPVGLRSLLEAAGFRVEETTALLHAPRFLAARMTAPDGQPSVGLQRLIAFERLERLPTRNLSGHFLAALVSVPR